MNEIVIYPNNTIFYVKRFINDPKLARIIIDSYGLNTLREYVDCVKFYDMKRDLVVYVYGNKKKMIDKINKESESVRKVNTRNLSKKSIIKSYE